MKLPPRAKKCMEYLDEIEFVLDYFMGGGSQFKDLKNKEIKYLREYIAEISESRKLSQIKLATKIKKDLDGSDS